MPLGETILRLAAIIRLTLSRSSLCMEGVSARPAAGAKAASENVVLVVLRKALRFICVVYASGNALVSRRVRRIEPKPCSPWVVEPIARRWHFMSATRRARRHL
jgi:hypothetical protein